MTNHKKHHKEEPLPLRPAEGEEVIQKKSSAGEESLQALQVELEKTAAQAAEYLDGWQRAQAELANYRKRMERDTADVRCQAAGRIAASWFPILDDFERALKEHPTTDRIDQWIAGLDLIYRKGVAALEAEGVAKIEVESGATFDPNLHEAITRESCPDKQDGEILEVVRRGYRLGDRVLRPAQVRVACKPENESPSQTS
jgi:molecular chaperone GrpE